VALLVARSADAEIYDNRMFGGAGRPSTGLWIDSTSGGLVHIHDNHIDGGTGLDQSYVGAFGLVVTGNDLTALRGNPVEHNVIVGGHGNRGALTGTYASVGVEVWEGSDLDLIGNLVDGGLGQDQYSTIGIHRSSGSNGYLRLIGNRISSGHTDNAQWGVFGVRLFGNGPAYIVNNMIAARADSGIGGARTIEVTDAPILTVWDNTLWVDSNVPGAALALAHFDPNNSLSNAYVDANIFGSPANGPSAAVLLEGCADLGTLRSLTANLNFGAPLLRYGPTPDGSCVAAAVFDRDDLAELELRTRCPETGGSTRCQQIGGTVSRGNVTVSDACGADADCIVRLGCSGSSACGQALFTGGSIGDVTALFAGGWRLAQGIPCAVAKSWLDLSDAVPTDLFGTPRPSTPSMGAYQVDDNTVACVP
jgi:hypothetical protein